MSNATFSPSGITNFLDHYLEAPVPELQPQIHMAVIPVPQQVDLIANSPLHLPTTPHSFEIRIKIGVLMKMRRMKKKNRKHLTLMTRRTNSVFLA